LASAKNYCLLFAFVTSLSDKFSESDKVFPSFIIFLRDDMSQSIEFNRSAVRPRQCISEGWNLIKPDYWLFFGIMITGFLITNCIPCTNIFLMGPIEVGIFHALFAKMRGKSVDFALLFKGFENYIPAMALGVIKSLPNTISQGIYYAASLSGYLEKIQRQTTEMAPDFAELGVILAISGIVILFLIVFGTAWQLTFIFIFPLTADHNLKIGETIKLSARAGWSNASGLIILSFLQFFIALAGVVAFCVGSYFVLPIIQASSAVAYRQVFPDISQPEQPPQPDYSETYKMPEL